MTAPITETTGAAMLPWRPTECQDAIVRHRRGMLALTTGIAGLVGLLMGSLPMMGIAYANGFVYGISENSIFVNAPIPLTCFAITFFISTITIVGMWNTSVLVRYAVILALILLVHFPLLIRETFQLDGGAFLPISFFLGVALPTTMLQLFTAWKVAAPNQRPDHQQPTSIVSLMQLAVPLAIVLACAGRVSDNPQQLTAACLSCMGGGALIGLFSAVILRWILPIGMEFRLPTHPQRWMKTRRLWLVTRWIFAAVLVALPVTSVVTAGILATQTPSVGTAAVWIQFAALLVLNSLFTASGSLSAWMLFIILQWRWIRRDRTQPAPKHELELDRPTAVVV